ncbi:MAG: GAF domain-containing protein [Spirochaetes bacterium]|nr:GAF domain-containing protein [Spirochaetota bacterium]
MSPPASQPTEQPDTSHGADVFAILETADLVAAVFRDHTLIRHTRRWGDVFASTDGGRVDNLNTFLSLFSDRDRHELARAIDTAARPARIDLEGSVASEGRFSAHFVTVQACGNDADSTLIVVGSAPSQWEVQRVESAEDRPSGDNSRYRDIFENAYVSLWEEDIRSLKEAAADARERGVTDIREYLNANPDIVREAARNVRVLDVNAETLRLYGAATKDELIGSLDRVFIDDTVPLFIEEIAAVFEGRERLEAEIRVRTLTGEDRYVIFSFAMPRGIERFDHVLVSMIDITERKRNQHEREELFQREHERHLLARTISHVTLSLTSLRHVDEVLDEILAAAVNLVPFESGNIALFREGRVEPVRWIGYQEAGAEELIRSMRPPIEGLKPNLRALETQRPHVVADTKSDPDWQPFPETGWIRSCLIVPIVYHDEVRGFLTLDSDKANHFSHEDGEKLTPLAQAAAVALENARLMERMEHEIHERNSAEKGLRRSLEEKELLVQEIHHRVKNNLAMVSSIIGLQKTELSDDQGLNGIFEELQARIRAIAAVHEQLHQTGSISRVQLADYIRDILGAVQSSLADGLGGVTISHDVEEVSVTAGEAPPVGLIVTEAVTNALKHAFPCGRSGSISVSAHLRSGTEHPRRVEIRVRDDGVGMEHGNPTQSTGVPSDQGSSLGMVLMKSLAEQLGGTLSFTHDGGTTLNLSFPTRALHESSGEYS